MVDDRAMVRVDLVLLPGSHFLFDTVLLAG